jgi:hypothetical protein
VPAVMTMEELFALPSSFDLPTAGRAFGMGRSKSFQMASRGEFPCKVLRLGRRLHVTKAHLFTALGIPLPSLAPAETEIAPPGPGELVPWPRRG